ncbi:MAG: hypothetical protein CDV28_10231 [Candidatus Electronema aureum]|uniref:MmeI-like N-terminal domain-containing protein n=1 Tax=Candidatus Electronema aureum TaxID=2005002 RepID=A0A521G4F7_9BACT|nr:MAG: hypothetical protein CDV28_10231 [Candidatus Electronema aureum]
MPPLSWNEIKSRALSFSRDWADEVSEDAEAKTFWNAFFHIFGIDRRRVASFEQRVRKIDGREGYIDLLWKGKLLIEHKSRGKDLDRAHEQALGYFPGLKERELPRYLLVSGYIMGNPPFGGKHYQNEEQRSDQLLVMHEIRSGSDLDFVANWFVKAAQYIDCRQAHCRRFRCNQLNHSRRASCLAVGVSV